MFFLFAGITGLILALTRGRWLAFVLSLSLFGMNFAIEEHPKEAATFIFVGIIALLATIIDLFHDAFNKPCTVTDKMKLDEGISRRMPERQEVPVARKIYGGSPMQDSAKPKASVPAKEEDLVFVPAKPSIKKNVTCPMCLCETTEFQKVIQTNMVAYVCPECTEPVPTLYVREYEAYPPINTSAIGFSGHGKTVYFASLFSLLKNPTIFNAWRRLYTLALNEESLDTVYTNMRLLEEGGLPLPTQRIFPQPTMVRIDGIPGLRPHTLVCYDTSGEAFERTATLTKYARYVARANSVMLFISLYDLIKQSSEKKEKPADMLSKLLNTYKIGMASLDGDTMAQHLIVVFSKADVLGARLAGTRWQQLSTFINSGSYESISDVRAYVAELLGNSKLLEDLICAELGAFGFVNMAKHDFASVEFCMVSALGAPPSKDNHLSMKIVPRRVLDPLILQSAKSSLLLPRQSTSIPNR